MTNAMHLCLEDATRAKVIEVKVCKKTITEVSLSPSVVLPFQHYSIHRELRIIMVF